MRRFSPRAVPLTARQSYRSLRKPLTRAERRRTQTLYLQLRRFLLQHRRPRRRGLRRFELRAFRLRAKLHATGDRRNESPLEISAPPRGSTFLQKVIYRFKRSRGLWRQKRRPARGLGVRRGKLRRALLRRLIVPSPRRVKYLKRWAYRRRLRRYAPK